MFHKPSEPKPGPSDTKARPLSNDLANAAAVASSSSSATDSTSPQQVASAASAAPPQPTITTTNDYSRLDDQQSQLSSQRQNRQAQQASKLSYSVNKQQIAATALHQHYLNYFNSNIPKEEAKSHRTRGSISHSLSQTRQLLQQQQQQLQQAVFPDQDHNPSSKLVEHTIVQPTTPTVVANQRSNNLQHHNHIYHISAVPNHAANDQHNHHYATPANNTATSVNNISRSVPRDTDIFMSHKMNSQQQLPPSQKLFNKTLNHRTYSTGAIASSHPQQQQQQAHHHQSHSMNPNKQQHAPNKILARSTRQGQLDIDSEDKVAAIKGELENDLEGYKNSELEAISSLERNLPIELTFLIRQQAHCMARMNYLDRQLRELKENNNHFQQQQQHHHPYPNHQQIDAPNQVSSTSLMNQGHYNLTANRHHQQHHQVNNLQPTTTMSNAKNGNFILSDDSGGEYSRATISDDDELSSLLDQIAKSVRPDQQQQQQQQHQHQHQQRPMMMSIAGDAMLSGQMHNMHHQQQQQRLTANYATFIGNPPPLHLQNQQQQSYALMNPNQMHHHQQAVPIFVMSSPIAVAHPSSISSNILPGVHFQPEPRYNQYYEDFYNTGAPHSVMATMPQPSAPPPQIQHRTFSSGSVAGGSNPVRSQQFDSSMSAVEQLVSQKEKRQIISQLKSADNWLKMRASGQGQDNSPSVKTNKQVATSAVVHLSHSGDTGQTTTTLPAANDAELRTNSSSTIKQEGGNHVIDENIDE